MSESTTTREASSSAEEYSTSSPITSKKEENSSNSDLSLDKNSEVDEILKNLEEERRKFSALKPLPTVLILSIGPLLTAVGQALHDSCDLLMISKAYGDYGITCTGLASLMRFFCVGVALFFGDAATLRLPYLIGQNRQEDAKKLVCDLFRVSLIVNVFFPFVAYFLTEPVLKYMNCPEYALKDAVGYILPICVTIPFTTLLHLSLGVLQGEGRSLLCGLIQLAVFVFNICILAPIILLGIKAPISWSGVPFSLAHGISGIIMTILIFSGKFSLKPTWSMWKEPLGKEVWQALKVASSIIISLMVGTWPPMLLTHYLYQVAFNINQFSDINNAFNTLMKIYPFVNSFTTGITQGFMTAASYSTGARQIDRFVSLAKWALLIALILQVIFIPIIVVEPWIVTRIWVSYSESGRYWANKLNGIPSYTQWVNAINEMVSCLLMSFGQGWVPYIPQVLKAIAMCVASYGLYERDPYYPELQLYVYNICDAVLIVCDIVFFFAIIIPYVKKERKIQKEGFSEDDEEVQDVSESQSQTTSV